MAETPFIESNALLALQRDANDEARGHLEQLLPGELIRLANTADELAVLARKIKRQKRLAEDARGGEGGR